MRQLNRNDDFYYFFAFSTPCSVASIILWLYISDLDRTLSADVWSVVSVHTGDNVGFFFLEKKQLLVVLLFVSDC